MQEKFETYFVKALHDAKVAEIAKRYQHDKRYNVLFGDDISEFHLKPDLVVKTKKTTTVFEVKVLPISKHYQRKINKLRREAIEKNYRFRLVTIARPITPQIEIDWLNDALYNYFITHKQEVIESMATHSHYGEVDAAIKYILIAGEKASVYVYGSVSVILQFGSNSENEPEKRKQLSHTFPFEGKLLLDLHNRTIELEGDEALRIDDSSWYGDEDF